MQAKIPLIRGPLGFVGWPIYKGHTLLGVEGPSGHRYVGTSLFCLGPKSVIGGLRFRAMVSSVSPLLVSEVDAVLG